MNEDIRDPQSNVPPLTPAPTDAEQQEQHRQEIYEDIKPYLLDATKDYPEPFYMLEYQGVPFSTIGGIQAISGQKKNGKTFVMAQLMAAILNAGSMGSHQLQYLGSLRVPQRTIDHLGHLPTVLYIDTEMEQLNSAKVLRRVHWLCEWETNRANSRFNVLWLRSIVEVKDDKGNVKEKAHERRYRLIKEAIEYYSPDAVFIDGIRDIIGDFNDNEESSQLVTDLMALAEQRHICIWNALHMNPRPGNDDESKMRGHLGTELGNKITDTLVSIKQKDASGQVTFTVKQNDARGKDLEDWTFEVTDDAGALGVPRILTSSEAAAVQTAIAEAHKQQRRSEKPELTLAQIAEMIQKVIPTPTSKCKPDIVKALQKECGLSQNKAYEAYHKALQNDMFCLTNTPNGPLHTTNTIKLGEILGITPF